MRRVLSIALVGCSILLSANGIAVAEPNMDPELRNKAKRAVDKGLRYLREHRLEDGSWSKSVGVTALALRAYLQSHRKYDESDGVFITAPIDFILKHVNDDGSIGESMHNRNYNTAVAITALQATGNPKYQETIRNAQNYLKGLQLDDTDGYPKEHKYFGGIGYGGDERPDLSNQYLAIEALRATALDPKDPLWERALVFVSRSQNNSETNDQEWAGNDGGFTYMPGYSPHGGTGSYGGMTHAGLISLLFAGVDKNDPRVQAAYKWIQANYTLEDNPGAKKKQGLFYYYHAFAKSMKAYAEPKITDANGVTHNWRNDLATKLLSVQDPDGAWVNTESGRWWEGNKDLVTAWSVIALNHAIND